MVKLQTPFDPRTHTLASVPVQPAVKLVWPLFPPGWYLMWVKTSRHGPTRKGGSMYELMWETVDQVQVQRTLFHKITDVNDKESAMRIGIRELSEVMEACGIAPPLEDTDDLHGIPCKVRVATRQDVGQPARNIVKEVRHAGFATPPEPTVPLPRGWNSPAAEPEPTEPAAEGEIELPEWGR